LEAIVKTFAIVVGVIALAGMSASAELVGWETNCEGIDGWYSNKTDPGMHSEVAQEETGVIRVSQAGEDTWGKAAIVAEKIDISKTPILEVRVNKVDADAGFSVKIAPQDWSELITVIERSSADGVHKGNIQKAINKQSVKPEAYAAPATFSVVVIIEGKGKAVWLDNLEIRSE
jgi:hypothetical protein